MVAKTPSILLSRNFSNNTHKSPHCTSKNTSRILRWQQSIPNWEHKWKISEYLNLQGLEFGRDGVKWEERNPWRHWILRLTRVRVRAMEAAMARGRRPEGLAERDHWSGIEVFRVLEFGWHWIRPDKWLAFLHISPYLSFVSQFAV